MKLELFIIGITGFLIYNAYHGGKYTKMYSHYKKYIQMAFYGIVGVSLYLLIKKNPEKCKSMLLHANNMVKYMPIDKSSLDMLSPIIDFTGSNGNGISQSIDGGGFMQGLNQDSGAMSNYEKRLLTSGTKSTKRSVSETKKKYVASMQNWKCGHCQKQLTAWFEVDHKMRLEYGGTNEVDNLVALCRECHGEKTAFENM
uniref:HNH nuclease domain-containing protein n=1 Tax=viral metagenome TaxID=1070528 RepID=A0A6C0KXZ4_9ZZZZ